jgi:photosystem II stability/assembly factor-like uncharacterized protein
MTKLILTFLLFACSAVAATSMSVLSTKADKTMKWYLPADLQHPKSTVGLNFCSVSSDSRGGVWLTGTAWLVRGLLINDRDGVLTTRLTHGVKNICQSRFTSADTGWMVDLQTFWKSTDAGMSWQQVRIPDLKRVSTFHFYDSQNGWVGGWAGEIYRTTDAGQTWAKAELPRKYEVQEIRFVDSLKGWAVGFRYLSPEQRMHALFRTEDGGRIWRELSNVDTDAQGGVRSLFFVSQSTGWGIGTRKQEIVQTRDGGETWTVKFSSEESRWNSIFFSDDRHGWAVGSGIASTSDGGATWSFQLHPLLAPGYLDSIIFTDAKHGWAAGPDVVLRTNDGGKTWRPLPDSWKNSIPGPQSLLNERP